MRDFLCGSDQLTFAPHPPPGSKQKRHRSDIGPPVPLPLLSVYFCNNLRRYLELFQPFKGQIELGFSNVMAQLLWLDCIEQVQVHLKRIDMQKAELGGSEGTSSSSDAAQAYEPYSSPCHVAEYRF